MTTTTDDVTAKFAIIADALAAARRVQRAAKKEHGPKSDQAKAARRTVRVAKTERATFIAANPGFVAPKAPKAPPATKAPRGAFTAEEQSFIGWLVRRALQGVFTLPEGVVAPTLGPALQALVDAAGEAPAVVAAAPVLVGVDETAAPVAQVALGDRLMDLLAAGPVSSMMAATALGVKPQQAAEGLRELVAAGKATKAGGRFVAVIA